MDYFSAMFKQPLFAQEWIDKEIDIPLERIGKPSEIAAIIRFLCGPDAGFFTGQTLSPNGGAVMI